jgi:hypothetical protein
MRLKHWALVVVCAFALTSFVDQAFAKDLSPQEMLEAAEAAVNKMKQTHEEVLAKLKAAREAGDTAAITELNEILTGIKGTLKDAEKNLMALKEAVANGDAEGAAALFAKVEAAGDKMQEFKGQMHTVGGPGLEGSVEGKMEVQKEASDALPPTDEGNTVDQVTGDYVKEGDEGKGYENEQGGEEEKKDDPVDPEPASGFL